MPLEGIKRVSVIFLPGDEDLIATAERYARLEGRTLGAWCRDAIRWAVTARQDARVTAARPVSPGSLRYRRAAALAAGWWRAQWAAVGPAGQWAALDWRGLRQFLRQYPEEIWPLRAWVAQQPWGPAALAVWDQHGLPRTAHSGPTRPGTIGPHQKTPPPPDASADAPASPAATAPGRF